MINFFLTTLSTKATTSYGWMGPLAPPSLLHHGLYGWTDNWQTINFFKNFKFWATLKLSTSSISLSKYSQAWIRSADRFFRSGLDGLDPMSRWISESGFASLDRPLPGFLSHRGFTLWELLHEHYNGDSSYFMQPFGNTSTHLRQFNLWPQLNWTVLTVHNETSTFNFITVSNWLKAAYKPPM